MPHSGATRYTRPMPRPAVAPPASHVETACPLDCPDACTLKVTLRGGRVTSIDGSTANEITRGYICAKVRRFHHRVYGDDRLLHPAVRKGPKGRGAFRPVTWDDALDLIAEKILDVRDRFGAESMLPLSLRRLQRFPDAGLDRRDVLPPPRCLTAAAHRVRRADRRRQPGPLREDDLGQLPGLPGRAAHRDVGREPVDVRHPPDAVPEGRARPRRASSS